MAQNTPSKYNSFIIISFSVANGTAVSLTRSAYKSLEANEYYFIRDPMLTIPTSFILPEGSPLEVWHREIHVRFKLMSILADPLWKYHNVAAWHWDPEQAVAWWAECSITHTWPKSENQWATWSLSSWHCFHGCGWWPDYCTSWLPHGTMLQVKTEQQRREETGIYKLPLYCT